MTATDTPTLCSVEFVEARIAPLRARLTSHPLYAAIRTPQHLRLFLESHVFAVWDFMSLLKALQSRLTCVTVPWTPSPYPASRRFLNEIVLGEESDEYLGRPISHFELYLEAMQDFAADTGAIRTLLQQVTENPGDLELDLTAVPAAARRFVETTFAILRTGRTHAIAAAFTFGREDVIPDMFRELVRDMHRSPAAAGASLDKLVWYLERHIEVDGEDHGPLSLRMVEDLCGHDEQRWEQTADAAATAIEARLALWDGILHTIQRS